MARNYRRAWNQLPKVLGTGFGNTLPRKRNPNLPDRESYLSGLAKPFKTITDGCTSSSSSVRASVLWHTSRWRVTFTAETFGFRSSPALTAASIRHLNIFSVFNKEAREKERARLKDEMNRGYFDDFRELKKTGGKVATASQNLVPVLAAGKFPKLKAYTTSGDGVSLPFENCPSRHATVVCMAFRASAQNMIESWTRPLTKSFESSTSVELIQISLVDSWFLSLPPMRHILLRIMRAPVLGDGEHTLKTTVAYVFGDTYFFRKELGIPNVLAGYLFLLDKKGRIRWRASGLATTEELSSMVSCISRLLEED